MEIILKVNQPLLEEKVAGTAGFEFHSFKCLKFDFTLT